MGYVGGLQLTPPALAIFTYFDPQRKKTTAAGVISPDIVHTDVVQGQQGMDSMQEQNEPGPAGTSFLGP